MHPAQLHQSQHGGVYARVQAEVVHHQADLAPRLIAAMLGALMKPSPRSSLQQGRIGWFLVVGCGAAAVHWVVVVALVGRLGVAPLLANVGGWMVAFAFSFAGHHSLTFRGHGRSPWQAARRFALVSSLGFSINEASYALMLGLTGARYDLVLAAVLVAVAGLTYLLGRRWAFLRAS